MISRRCFFTIAFAVVAVVAFAQVKTVWGNTDTRYPLEAGAAVKNTAVNKAVAWRGERVNFQLLVQNIHTFSHGHVILSWHLIVGGPRITQSEKVKKERYRKVIFSCFIFSFLPEISQLIWKKSIFFHLRTLYTASLILSKLTSTFKTNNEAQEDNLLPCKTT